MFNQKPDFVPRGGSSDSNIREAFIASSVPDVTLSKWQNIVDIMAEIIGVPSGLIMRIVGNDIQVFVASKTEGNPYRIGHAEHLFGSGLYCETVVKENAKLPFHKSYSRERKEEKTLQPFSSGPNSCYGYKEGCCCYKCILTLVGKPQKKSK